MGKIINEELSKDVEKINETIVTVQQSLDPKITNTIYYTKLKYLMFNEIVRFCKEKIDLKQDLLSLRMSIGEFMSEEDIRATFDRLKAKYNVEDSYIGLEYHVEMTRVDYGVCLFAMIRRGDVIYAKKFIFRYRKTTSTGMDFSGISAGSITLPDIKQDILDMGGKKDV